MLTAWIPFQSFWSAAWAAPLRGACAWLEGQPTPDVPATPDALAPDWIRPLWLQQAVGKALAARLQRMETYPNGAPLYFGEASRPLWTREGWTPLPRAMLRAWDGDALQMRFLLELERLLRMTQVSPWTVGADCWTRAALGSCERLAQMYHELRRRCPAWKRRRWMGRLLEEYIRWEPIDDEDEEPAEARG